MADLIVEAFLSLRNTFFDATGSPKRFSLRKKEQTQDDPLDEHLATVVLAGIPGVTCIRAPGALTTPDMVLLRPDRCKGSRAGDLRADLQRIVGLEVKKLERGSGGKVARTTGLDYNTTPPCGTIRVYDKGDTPVSIRGFYLFVCKEAAVEESEVCVLTALALVDGDLLNADYDLYTGIVGERKKQINLGTYRDGADRKRPMLIFANPLGVRELDHKVSLVHPSPDLASGGTGLRLVHEILRTRRDGGIAKFFCYRTTADVPELLSVTVLTDPFPTPKRAVKTQGRGKFRLPFSV